MEFSGSLGDLGLFIPLVVGMTVTCGLAIGPVLIWAGIMNILTGWYFRQPVPVQPMKAIAAVAITEELMRGELVAAGLGMGLILILLSGVIGRVNEFIPKAVVRGIQLGIGLKLATKGAQWISALPAIGWDGIIIAVPVILILLGTKKINQPVLVYLFLAGLGLLFIKHPAELTGYHLEWPVIMPVWPKLADWPGGLVKGVLPQLPLTVLNSVIALCALSGDYFPGRGLKPNKVVLSVGIMNLVCVPFGGVPMCHGAGGLAAQYRFGARTGGSVMMLGVLKLFVGLFFGGVLLDLLRHYPTAVLAPMLIFAGIELAKSARDVMEDKKGIMVALITGIFIIGVNTWAGFLAGITASMVLGVQPKRVK